jgi:DNA replication protein DnaC
MKGEHMEKLSYPHSNYLFYIPPAFHHCTLNNFEWKGQNKDLLNAIKTFVEGDIKGFYLYGSFGVGKTHLMVALYRVLVAMEDDISDIY